MKPLHKEIARPDPIGLGSERRRRRRRFSPLMLAGVLVPLILALAGGALYLIPRLSASQAAAPANPDCTLIVPPHPLTARGLATPYQLVASDPARGPCHEANPDQAAFVQAAIIDPSTGHIFIYNPLVVDQGQRPALAPVVPRLPPGGIVGIWFGFNGENLTLRGMDHSLTEGHCVNGIRGSLFGQFAYCNAPAFFAAANQAIRAGKLKPPPLGQARDGLPCPSVRDFSLVDQDQSDNVTTAYLVTRDGRIAQMTRRASATLEHAQPQVNSSDNRLLAIGLDGALGCTPWMAPDLADPGQMTTALPLNELQAAIWQRAPVALVPNGDPMVTVDGHPNLAKLNAYRAGVDQPQVRDQLFASTTLYCANLLAIAPLRLLVDAPLTKTRPSPDPAVANSLFTFLAQRFITTFEVDGLNCTRLLHVPDPVQVQRTPQGVAVAATINGAVVKTPLDCNVNGTLIVGCNGMATLNGQTCSLMTDRRMHQIIVTCPANNRQ
ncbi:MAG: hypothetical protein IRZ24_08815 [Thermogemmatispora sp.]|uniref:hypothetical protein n=1 Tax=Thermogemmatispora sp. TaxID=1968838 RepID=UPI001D8364E2|nr:hypothetical protein [Thermogemmatispora sp.]MBX5450155.1 hypothetical protein [Thermogemmatispora sp.]